MSDELHAHDEAVQATPEQWRHIEEVYRDQIAQLPEIKWQRLMYGQWVVWECEECRSTANVKRYVDTSRSTHTSVYLCDACINAGHGTHAKQLREWQPGDR